MKLSVIEAAEYLSSTDGTPPFCIRNLLYKAMESGDLKHTNDFFEMPSGGSKTRYKVEQDEVLLWWNSREDPPEVSIKEEIEVYLDEFIQDLSPLYPNRIKTLLRQKNTSLVQKIDDLLKDVSGTKAHQWTMIKFYYGITVFNPDIPLLCEEV